LVVFPKIDHDKLMMLCFHQGKSEDKLYCASK